MTKALDTLASKVAARIFETASEVHGTPEGLELSVVMSGACETLEFVAQKAGVSEEALISRVRAKIDRKIENAQPFSLEGYYGDPLTNAKGERMEPEVVHVEIDGR